LDIFDGPVGSNQIHDYNPGIEPSGLFWTMPAPRRVVKVNLARATASLTMTDLAQPDYFTFLNSITVETPPVPARVSFDVRWSGVLERVTIRNDAEAFTGQFILDNATCEWSARQRGFQFQSDPAHTSKVVAAQIGRQQSGVLRHHRFDEEDDRDD
jgi:hypothetical protein